MSRTANQKSNFSVRTSCTVLGCFLIFALGSAAATAFGASSEKKSERLRTPSQMVLSVFQVDDLDDHSAPYPPSALPTRTPPASAGGQWYALGFRSSGITDNWFKGTEPGTALYTGDGNGFYFLGEGAVNSTTTSFTSGSSQTFSIILDTTPVLSSDWTLEFKVGGVTQRAATAFGYTPSINYVGFSSSIAGGSADNFSLSVVPEPSTLAMCALMGFSCLARYGVRRRKLNKTILKTV